MPKEKRVELRVDLGEWERWKEQAWSEKRSLGDWIRLRCAGPTPENVSRATFVRREPQKGERTVVPMEDVLGPEIPMSKRPVTDLRAELDGMTKKPIVSALQSQINKMEGR